MTPTELTLVAISTLFIGAADAFGGHASRRAAPFSVAAWSQAIGVPVVVVGAVLIGGELIAQDLAFGVAAGCGSALGVVFLYRGFRVASIGIVAPIASSVAAVVPIALGLASGERPSMLVALGIGLAVMSIFLVSYVRPGGGFSLVGITHGLMSGVGFGLMVVSYAATSEASGIWSAVTGRTTAALLATAAVFVFKAVPSIPREVRASTALAGILAAIGMIAFVTVSQTADLIVLGVTLGLFPTTTVVFAALFLKDRLAPWQWAGIATAATAVTLISIG